MNIPIIYEDDWLLVLDKPSGLLTVPAQSKIQRNLTDILNNDLKERNIAYRLHPCHRLDKDTSGLIIYAKGKAVQKTMMLVFKERKIKKTYLSFLSGSLEKDEGEIKIPVEGMQALTKYKTVERKKGYTIAKAYPLTGRTNQLRIHFKHLGHPILGERVHAFRRDFAIKAKRLCLHAQELEFTHPVTHKRLHLYSPMPLDMEEVLKKND